MILLLSSPFLLTMCLTSKLPHVIYNSFHLTAVFFTCLLLYSLVFCVWLFLKKQTNMVYPKKCQMKSYSVMLGGVKFQMLCWKIRMDKDGELAVVISIVKAIGDCDSSDFDHHLFRALKTCSPAQTYSIRNSGMGPAIHVLKSPLCDTIA